MQQIGSQYEKRKKWIYSRNKIVNLRLEHHYDILSILLVVRRSWFHCIKRLATRWMVRVRIVKTTKIDATSDQPNTPISSYKNHLHHDSTTISSHVIRHQVKVFANIHGSRGRHLRDLLKSLFLENAPNLQQSLLKTKVLSSILVVIICYF